MTDIIILSSNEYIEDTIKGIGQEYSIYITASYNNDLYYRVNRNWLELIRESDIKSKYYIDKEQDKLIGIETIGISIESEYRYENKRILEEVSRESLKEIKGKIIEYRSYIELSKIDRNNKQLIGNKRGYYSICQLLMGEYTDSEIERYINLEEYKYGGLQIDKRGGGLIKNITGDLNITCGIDKYKLIRELSLMGIFI